MATARKRISELTALTSASLDTVVVGVDNGITYKIELDTLADAVTSRVNILDRDRLQSLESVTSSFETKGRSIVSSSAQISNLGFVLSSDTSSFVRESETGSFLTSIPNGIISSSAQITNFGFVSTSVDITHLNSFTGSQTATNVAFTNAISARLQTSSFNEFSASVNQRILDATNEQNLSNLATTGSNTFVGNQKITGSVSILIPGGTAYAMNENPTPNNEFWAYVVQYPDAQNVAVGWTATIVGGSTYTVTAVNYQHPFNKITLSDGSLTMDYRIGINFSKSSKLWEFNSNGTLTGLPDGLVSGSSQLTSSYDNRYIQSGSSVYAPYLYSTNSTGDEGGEINLALPQTNTTLTGSVVVDVWRDRVRIFEAGGNNRGGYFDLTTLGNGVSTNLAPTLYLLEAYANVTYTLPGSFTEDPCRYSVVNNTVNVSSSWFNTSTYTFTPQKAGYWEITATYDVYRLHNVEAAMAIKKNNGIVVTAGAFGVVAQQVTKIVYLNGSTDFINVVNVGGAANSRSQYEGRSWFQARWVGE
jgi:hypothetical protein